MKVLFLDIDGVLVTPAHITEHLNPEDPHATYVGVDEWEADREEAIMPYARFDPRAVRLLNKITQKTGAKIVVSSTWRLRGQGEITRILREQEVWAPVIGVTPSLRSHQARWLRDLRGRGNEIAAWLDEHPEVERFAILDDDQDMTFLCPHLFATGGDHGLTEEIADWVIDYLDETSGQKEAWGAGAVAGTPNRSTRDFAWILQSDTEK